MNCDRQTRTDAVEIQPDVPLPLQPLAVNSLEARDCPNAKRRVDHLVNRLVEAVIVKSHALGQRAEQFHVGSALAQRLNRLLRHLQIVVPIGGLQVFVLEERGRGQNNVGVVGRCR